jgi:hypothetical protein
MMGRAKNKEKANGVKSGDKHFASKNFLKETMIGITKPTIRRGEVKRISSYI